MKLERKTKETDISLELDIYGSGKCDISTGVGFFDHMLTAMCVHGGFDMTLSCKGDLHVDCHHTVEDCGIVMGKAFGEALGDKSGIARFGTAYVPMDEALAFVSLDISNRPYLVFDAAFKAPMCGDYDTQMTAEFFRAFAVNAGITLHAKLMYGENAHHATEALYKALARALKEAVKKNGGAALSSKGVL